VDESQDERIVLTRHGKPIAVLTGVEDKDLEGILLAQDAGFRQLIEDRRRYQGPLVSHRTLQAQANEAVVRERRRAHRHEKVRKPRRPRR
jgi:antitoxin (DNA-binding transcriptional repressor) of toxin-antitoxin stability system